MRRIPLLALLSLAAPAAGSMAAAQSPADIAARLGPQFVSYTFHAPIDEFITEFAVPIYVAVPINSSFHLDIGTAYARTHADAQGVLSDVSGLTDTQIRGTYTIGNDLVVITGGVNIPTGSSTVGPDQLIAASRIGSDFLGFPVTNMGTGFGGTLGAAFAKPVGDWNFGLGASVRHSSPYDPYNDGAGNTVHYEPGDEYRVRAGLDRPIGSGQFSLGLTFSTFGADAQNSSVYNTGSRIIVQTSLVNQMLGGHGTLAAWSLYRGAGTLASGSASGAENIGDVYFSVGYRPMGILVEPNVEARAWVREGALPSAMGMFGVRTHLPLGPIIFMPSVHYSMGKMAGDGASANLSGLQAVLIARISR